MSHVEIVQCFMTDKEIMFSHDTNLKREGSLPEYEMSIIGNLSLISVIVILIVICTYILLSILNEDDLKLCNLKEDHEVTESGTLDFENLSTSKEDNSLSKNAIEDIIEEKNACTPCGAGKGVLINVEAQSSTNTDIIMKVCFNKSTAETLYVEHELNPENGSKKEKVARKNFTQGEWYPGLSVNNLYKKDSQKSAIASVVGDSKANEYVTPTTFLARGHLAAKTDFILSSQQRATSTFINAAPQFQRFNAGNWFKLENNLKKRINKTKRKTKVYTGTWDMLKLKDSSGSAKDIYLSPSNRKIPVSLWFYKVVHEIGTNRATVFLGLNNPHVTLAEARSLAFCTDISNDKDKFGWIKWKNEDVQQGFCLICTVDDFKKTVNHLPNFPVNGLFY